MRRGVCIISPHAHESPIFVDLQYCTLKKFMKCDFELNIFDDSSNDGHSEKIKNHCEQYQEINYFRIPKNIHNASDCISDRNGNSVNYAYRTVGLKSTYEFILILDADVILTSDFVIYDYMHGYEMSGLQQSKLGKHTGKVYKYLWVGFIFIRIHEILDAEIISFSPGKVGKGGDASVDTGGQTYNYLNEHKNLRLRFCNPNDHETSSLFLEYFEKDKIIKKFEGVGSFLSSIFWNYQGGTNWDYQEREVHGLRINNLIDFVEKVTNYTIDREDCLPYVIPF